MRQTASYVGPGPGYPAHPVKDYTILRYTNTLITQPLSGVLLTVLGGANYVELFWLTCTGHPHYPHWSGFQEKLEKSDTTSGVTEFSIVVAARCVVPTPAMGSIH
jgi:hypothetical protein